MTQQFISNTDEVCFTDTLYPEPWCGNTVTDDERDKAIGLLCEHLKVRIVRTNMTKHGTTEIELEIDE